jgi:hypothetical protein
MKRVIKICLTACCLPLIGCANMREVGKKSAAMVRNTSAATTSTISSFSLSDLLPGSKIKIVKVREKDLKDLPTGHERAMAFQNTKRGRFWIFGGPVDFKEPTLPEDGCEADGSLLPPKIQ